MMLMKAPASFQNRANSQIQMMEAPTESKIKRYLIQYDILDPSQTHIADILWLKKVARFALKKGFHGFNILEEKVKPQGVEGIIELESDNMNADYNCYEILQLEIPGFK